MQTERIGPFLGGSVKVIEGRGYADDGAVRFNAFGIVSFDPATRAYTMHSHAQGHVGDFAFVPTADGYRWEIPLPTGRIRYVATVAATSCTRSASCSSTAARRCRSSRCA